MSDEYFYLEASREIDSDNTDPAIWSKAITLERGNIENARYRYVELRVEQLNKLPTSEGNGSNFIDGTKRSKTNIKEGSEFIDLYSEPEPEPEPEPNHYVSANPQNKLGYQAPQKQKRIFRKLCGLVCIGTGCSIIFIALSILGDSKSSIGTTIVTLLMLLSFAYFPIVDGYKEAFGKGSAGLGVALLGVLILLSQSIVFINWIMKNNIDFETLMALPYSFSLHGIVFIIILCATFFTWFGFSGIRNNTDLGKTQIDAGADKNKSPSIKHYKTTPIHGYYDVITMLLLSLASLILFSAALTAISDNEIDTAVILILLFSYSMYVLYRYICTRT